MEKKINNRIRTRLRQAATKCLEQQQIQKDEYIELQYSNDGISMIDNEVEKLLNNLKYSRIPNVLQSENIYKYKIPWSSKGINRDDHAEHILQFNKDFYNAIQQQIDQCIQSRVIPITTPSSSTTYKILLSISEQICRLYNISMENYSNVSQLRYQLERDLFEKIPSNEYLVILFDSIDQLSSSDAYDCKWLPINYPKNIKFELIYNDWLKIKQRSLSNEQYLFILNLLNNRSEILPLFMKLIFDIILTWHSYDIIDENFKKLQTIDDCILYLLNRLKLIHGNLLVSRSLCYLTASKNGLSQNELEDVLSLDDEVLQSIFQHYIPPVKRLPGILWTRIRNDLDEYLTEKEVDDISVIYWYHRRFIEIAMKEYVSTLTEKQKTNLFRNMVDLYNETWSGKTKLLKLHDENLIKKYNLTDVNGEVQANRFISFQPIEFVDENGQTQFNKRKLTGLPHFLSKLEANVAIPIAAERIFFDYSFMRAKLFCSSFDNINEDLKDIDGLSTYGLGKKIIAIKEEISIHSMVYLVTGSLLEKYPENYNFEISSRLLRLFGIKSYVTSLIKQLDTQSISHCSLIVPYCQIEPPGGGLVQTFNQHISSIVCLKFIEDISMFFSLSDKIVVFDMKHNKTIADINLPKLDQSYLNCIISIFPAPSYGMIFFCSLQNGSIHVYNAKNARDTLKTTPSFPRTNQSIQTIQLFNGKAITLDKSKRLSISSFNIEFRDISEESKFIEKTINQLNIQCSMMFSSILTINSSKYLIIIDDIGKSMAIWSNEHIIYINLNISQNVLPFSSYLLSLIGESSQDYISLHFNNRNLILCQVKLEESNKKAYINMISFDEVDKFCLKKHYLVKFNNNENKLNWYNIILSKYHQSIQMSNEFLQLCMNESSDYIFSLIKPCILYMYRTIDNQQLAKLILYDLASFMVADNDSIVLSMNDRRLLTLMIADPKDPTLTEKIRTLPSRNSDHSTNSESTNLVQQLQKRFNADSSDDGSDLSDYDSDTNSHENNKIYWKTKMSLSIPSFRLVTRFPTQCSPSKMNSDEKLISKIIPMFCDDSNDDSECNEQIIHVVDSNHPNDQPHGKIENQLIVNSTIEDDLNDIRQSTLEHERQQIRGIQFANAGHTNVRIINNYPITSNTCSLF
ncbi:hypothetical protein I4U23_027345 [Adineta vaga]|nr:hypothetical protein I4U23_027345 [Adineta vaga]